VFINFMYQRQGNILRIDNLWTEAFSPSVVGADLEIKMTTSLTDFLCRCRPQGVVIPIAAWPAVEHLLNPYRLERFSAAAEADSVG
jgi:hypothetical protein